LDRSYLLHHRFDSTILIVSMKTKLCAKFEPPSYYMTSLKNNVIYFWSKKFCQWRHLW